MMVRDWMSAREPTLWMGGGRCTASSPLVAEALPLLHALRAAAASLYTVRPSSIPWCFRSILFRHFTSLRA
ncbi:unnamed protein product, partial [Musa acuminata var. zebrina]